MESARVQPRVLYRLEERCEVFGSTVWRVAGEGHRDLINMLYRARSAVLVRCNREPGVNTVILMLSIECPATTTVSYG